MTREKAAFSTENRENPLNPIAALFFISTMDHPSFFKPGPPFRFLSLSSLSSHPHYRKRMLFLCHPCADLFFSQSGPKPMMMLFPPVLPLSALSQIPKTRYQHTLGSPPTDPRQMGGTNDRQKTKQRNDEIGGVVAVKSKRHNKKILQRARGVTYKQHKKTGDRKGVSRNEKQMV